MLVFAYFSPTVTHTPLQFSSMEIKGELELQRITQARNWHTFNLCMVLVILRTEIWQETRRKGSCPRRERRGTWNEKYLTKRTRTETTAKKPPPPFTSHKHPSRRLTHLSPPTTKKSSEISGTRRSTESTLRKRDLRERNPNSPLCSRSLSTLRLSLIPSRVLPPESFKPKRQGARIIQS